MLQRATRLSCGMSKAVVVDAGSFGTWLNAMRAVLRGEQDADVPCGDCVGCCISAYPIPLRPTDRVALETVPAAYLQLPSEPGGLARMGYDTAGSCPMLRAGRCSIYSDRPRTCRDYDCRVYAAAGLLPDGDRPVIHERVGAWRFGIDSSADQDAAVAVRRAAQFIRRHASAFPPAMRAGSATAAAVLAVKIWELFVQSSEDIEAEDSVRRTVQEVVTMARAFDDAA
jgi:hypothetical protein